MLESADSASESVDSAMGVVRARQQVQSCPAMFAYEGMKRIVDGLVALVGLLALAPLFALIALLIRLDSPGGVFFAHERVGRYGRKFKVLKFRTMVQDAPQRGAAITAGCDPRITRVGRILRTTKLDELPQLWNVLKGEMSLVGPRPEVEKYVQLWEPALREVVLSVRPGITGLTQIRYRHEERLLAQHADPEKYYRETLLPLKLQSDVEYVQRRSVWFDAWLLARTLYALFEREQEQSDSTANPKEDSSLRSE